MSLSDWSVESLTLPSSTYSVQSVYSPLGESIDADDGDEMFMTVSMDDTSPGPPPISPQRGTHSATESNKIQTGKEYFGTLQEGYGGLAAGSPRTGSAERSSAQIPPHIAYQDKKQRQSSVDLAESIRKRNLSGGSAATSTVTSPVPDGATTPYSDRAVSGELDDAVTRSAFRLTEPPRIRRSAGSRSISKNLTPVDAPGGSSQNEARDDQSSDSSPNEPVPAPGVPRRRNSSRLLPALDSDRGDSQSLMGDMQRKPSVRQLMARKEVSADASKLSQNFLPGQPQVLSNNLQSTLAASFLADGPPARSAARPNSAHRPINPLTRLEGMSTVSPALDATASPAQPGSRHKPQESTSSIQSENFQSERYPSALPAPSPMPDFSMEEEMGRIMRGEENEGPSSGLFHRVSKAVRHNRSHSDNNKPTVSPRWGSGRTIRNGSAELGSPLVSATGVGDSKEEVIQLRNRLNVVHQRMSEVESERDLLHEKINGTIDLRQVNSELREKRSTVAFLDTQREMVIRELEIMTEHLGRAKDSSEPLDMADMKSEALKDFTASLRKLKDTLGVQIEELVHKKNDLNVDLGNLNQHRDRVLGELERTTARHTQLYELNNQLVHNIQELYTTGGKANGAAAMPMPMPVPLHAPPVSSGLGIYNNGTRIDQSLDHRMSVEARSSADHSMSQISGLSGDTEVASEGGSGLSGPQVVSIRKGVGQPKKFSWKKSGAVAKNVTKGFKGAFGLNENQQTLREEFAESAPYGSLPHGEAPLAGATASPPPSRLGTDQGRHALAMRQAAASKGFARTTTPGGNKETPPPVVAARADTGKPEETQQTTAHLLTRHAAVFGSELTARCDFERRVIPAIVTRCIEEVERRGISVEGIYRKSGSATQVKAIQASFERDYTAGHEVGNPELDIHAVTSALKQYLRRLPTPLITWECYDPLLDAASSAPGDEVDADERVRRVRHCVDALPPRHRDTLEFLVAHLVRVMGMEQQNLVSPSAGLFLRRPHRRDGHSLALSCP